MLTEDKVTEFYYSIDEFSIKNYHLMKKFSKDDG
jgi:hypothetical protein